MNLENNNEKKIFVQRTGGTQLGNFLYKIATAIYYREEFGYEIFLDKKGIPGLSFNYPTKDYLRNRETNEYVPFDKSILSKFDWYGGNDNKPENFEIIHNDYSDTIIVPTKNIMITGYCQNINLFKKHLNKMPKYLNLNDNTIRDYINSKYKNVKDSIVIGVRAGEDWKNMIKLQRESYISALNKLKELGVSIENLFIMSNVRNVWEDKFDLQKDYPAIVVDEDCITQFYLGMMCNNFVLSESTFHLWVAYLGTLNNPNKKVIVFEDTDPTNRPLCLPNKNWIKVKY